MARKIFRLERKLAAEGTAMSKKRGFWAIAPLSAVLDFCKRTADRGRRYAARLANQLGISNRGNPQQVVQVTKASCSSPLDFAGKPAELTEFIKQLSIGDRIRVFCDDGIVRAEKVSQTQFKEIHAETMTELVH
jgi:hypothetical protein